MCENFRKEPASRTEDWGLWDGRHRESCMRALGALGPMEPDGGQWEMGCAPVTQSHGHTVMLSWRLVPGAGWWRAFLKGPKGHQGP